MSPKGNWFFRGLMFLAIAAAMSCAIRSLPGYEKNPTLPQVSGSLKVPGLNGEVKVFRDKWGVPHIFTEDAHDLFFADGYVQAQDRLWEMVLFRALATGRLCELFGNIGIPGESAEGMQVSMLAMDKRQRVMGMNFIGLVGEVLLAKTTPEVLAQMQAYCDGINAFLKQNKNHLPIEFQVLYIEPEPFRPADVISLSRFYGSMLCANMDMELLRYAIARKYGEDMAWKILPLHESLGPTVVPKEMLQNRLPAPRPLPPGGRPDPSITGLTGDDAMKILNADYAMRSAMFFPSNQASNNWVVSPKLTTTGTAMLANDPHLFHIEPSLCYAMHLKGAGYDAYGVVFPGQPYIVMGHTRKLSWGATVTNADVQDLFVETVDKNHPGKYLYKGEWKDFVVRKETIRIRPGLIQLGPTKHFQEKTITIRSTVHGPVINDGVANLPKKTPPLALRWVGYDFSRAPQMFSIFIDASSVEDFKARIEKIDFSKLETINVAQMFDILMKGQGINDFIRGMSKNELINMNWVGADADGHIIYLPGGLVPIRKKGTGTMPVPGEKGEYDWVGFIPLMETPHAIDPERGYMVSANNQVVDAQWYPYIFGTDYDFGWRAWRIEELINQLKPLDMNKMRRIQNDVHVKQAEIFVPLILKAVEVKKVKDPRLLKAAKMLREWNYEATIDSAATSIFYETVNHLTDETLKDKFPRSFYSKYIRDAAENTVQMWVIKGQSEFFDNKKTKGKVEDVNDVLVASLDDAVKWLTKTMGKDMDNWQWGKIHTIKWYNPMGFMALRDMSIGPYPHPGGSNTVRCAGSEGTGPIKYKTFEGPVMRHIIDMGDPDHSMFVIDGSESGQWLSPHYKDMHTLWYNSQYMTAEMRPEKIQEQAESALILKP
jgi:penicillin amidase